MPIPDEARTESGRSGFGGAGNAIEPAQVGALGRCSPNDEIAGTMESSGRWSVRCGERRAVARQAAQLVTHLSHERRAARGSGPSSLSIRRPALHPVGSASCVLVASGTISARGASCGTRCGFVWASICLIRAPDRAGCLDC
jgi:hypothetical protein